MTDSRVVAAAGKPEVPPARSGLIASWVGFWFTQVDPIGLRILRVLAGLLFLGWLLPFAGDPGAWFGLNGWFDATAYAETSRIPELPPHLFSWSVLYLCGTNASLLTAYWVSIGVLLLFTLGLWTRVTSLLTWIVVVSFTANPASAWDVDPLLRMLAFYLMVGHVLMGQMTAGVPFVNRLLGGRSAPAQSVAANLAVRLFQVHFAIGMVASGLLKLQTQEWWRGLTFWFYAHAPFHTTLEEVQGYYPPSAENTLFYVSLATYAMLAWQIGFPGFAWRRSLRPILIGGAVIALLVSVLMLRWPLIGPMMVIGCLSYLTPTEWRWMADRLTWLPGLREAASLPAHAPKGLAGRGGKKEGKVAATSGGIRP
jgi:hypothetical protein